MKHQNVESLLNQLYAQPDLKTDIFKFLEPIILKSYALLNNDVKQVVDGKSQLSFSSRSNSIYFSDERLEIETILYNDLPKVIDYYTQLPLEYRNKNIFKEGKTHREILIETIEILANRLHTIELNSYEQLDKSASIAHSLIREKYEDKKVIKLVTMAEEKTTPQLVLEREFEWHDNQENPIDSMMDKMNNDGYQKIQEDNRKIRLVEGQIQ